MPIHITGQPGDYAPVVLLPGDPNRATRIAARFDGGLEASRLVSEHRGLLGYTGTVERRPGLGPDDDDGHAHDDDRHGGAADARRDDVHPRRHDRRLRDGSGIGDAVVALSAASLSGIGDDPRRRRADRARRPTSRWSRRSSRRPAPRGS